MIHQQRRTLAIALAVLGLAFVMVHQVITPLVVSASLRKEQAKSQMETSLDKSATATTTSSKNLRLPLRYPSRSFTLPPGYWKDLSRWDPSKDWESYWQENLSRAALQYLKDQDFLSPLPGHDSCLDPLGPTPVILMGLGHAESQITFQVLSNLTFTANNKDSNKRVKTAYLPELTGSSSARSIAFFQFLERQQEETDQDSEAWLESYLCRQQAESPKAPLVGFQWKPYQETLEMPASQKGLDRLITLSEANAAVPIVRLRRNVLDSYIANKQGSDGKKVALQLDGLYKKLLAIQHSEDYVDRYLTTYGIPFVLVDYETLFFEGEDTSRKAWKRVWKALPEEATLPSWKTIRRAFSSVLPESLPSQRQMISNYREVAKQLKGTDLEYLLRP